MKLISMVLVYFILALMVVFISMDFFLGRWPGYVAAKYEEYYKSDLERKPSSPPGVEKKPAVDESTRVERYGQFGDSFGPLGATFSGLAFFAAFGALVLQARLYAKDKEERQDAAAERVFYSQLDVLMRIISEMDVDDDHKSRDCFKFFFDSMNHEVLAVQDALKFCRSYGLRATTTPLDPVYESFSERFPQGYMSYVEQIQRGYYDSDLSAVNWVGEFGEEELDYRWVAVVAYNRVYQENETDLSNYLRVFYRIILDLDKSVASKDLKWQLVSFLRAQLTNFELAVLFFNGIGLHGGKCVDLFSRYAMFDNMPTGLIFNTGLFALYGSDGMAFSSEKAKLRFFEKKTSVFVDLVDYSTGVRNSVMDCVNKIP